MLLLMLMLPVRGAMAAAMLCLPQDGPQKLMVQHLAEKPSGHGQALQHGHDHASHGHGQHAHTDATESSHDSDTASLDADDCNLCASFCSLTPLASSFPDLRHPRAQPALNPSPPVTGPSLVLDGEDRPPRTI